MKQSYAQKGLEDMDLGKLLHKFLLHRADRNRNTCRYRADLMGGPWRAPGLISPTHTLTCLGHLAQHEHQPPVLLVLLFLPVGPAVQRSRR